MRYEGEVSGVVQRRRDFALEIAFGLFSQRAIEAVNMTDIADEAHMGVASLYRYFGTKQELVVQLSALKWREQIQRIDEKYESIGGDGMDALEKLEFYLSCCIDLYSNYKDLLRFNANFQNYILHEVIPEENLKQYGEGIGSFFRKVHCAWKEAQEKGYIREAFAEQDSYISVICSMFFLAQNLAQSSAWPDRASVDYERVLYNHKKMIMEAIKI